MRDARKEAVMKIAIQEYKNSIVYGFSSNTANAIHMMEDAYQMCASFNIEGNAELRKIIDEAKEKYKNELNSLEEKEERDDR